MRQTCSACFRATGLQAAVLFVAAACLLVACAPLQPARHGTSQILEHYAFDARFALRQGEQSYSGRLSWRHAGEFDSVLLQDPFGRGVADIEQRPGYAKARLAEGRVIEAADAADLVFELTGVRLSLAGIGAWLPARLADADGATRDVLGRLVGLRRDGWQIEYGYVEDVADALPARIFARHGDLELRLGIENWELVP